MVGSAGSPATEAEATCSSCSTRQPRASRIRPAKPVVLVRPVRVGIDHLDAGVRDGAGNPGEGRRAGANGLAGRLKAALKLSQA